MKTIMNKIFLSSTIALLLLTCLNSFSQTEAINLKCEHLKNPIGIDAKNPRLSWQMKSNNPGSSQKAYQLVVGTTKSDVVAVKGDIWESGPINTSTVPVVYQGVKLQPFTRYYWSVRVQDQDGVWSDNAPTSFFETGLMDQKNWKGKWISDTWDINRKPAPYFRKELNINKEIESAKAYIAVAGLYELSINGNRIGDHRLDPAYTRFDRRNLYVTYDVTENLKQGKNAIGVLLGNGWYNQKSKAHMPHARPTFCMDLRVTYSDGTVETISTDEEWRTALSPVIFNSIYTGEHYDARLELPGWDTPNFNSDGWKGIQVTATPSQNITSQMLHPIRNVTEISAVKMEKQDENTWLFDFGRNIAGVTRIKISGPEGATIRLKHGERLDEDGRVDLSNINGHYRPDDSDPFQTDIFILNGKGENEFMARFNYKGFQYVEVSSSKALDITKESLTAYFMHSDVPSVGNINSSNTTLNKIWQAGNASYLSNLFGYPTDCPQREKNGWTGDAHIAIETGLYNYDGITVYEKYLDDHRDEQQPNGVLPNVIPRRGGGYDWANGPDWTSTIAIIPWNIYLFYGDTRILEENYDNIKLFVDYLDENYPSGITDWGLGDWVPVKSKTPKEFTSTAYFYADAIILSKTAKILGKQSDFEKYKALAAKIKKAVNEKYLNFETGIYGSGFQTELSVALFWGLAPDNLRGKIAENLAKRVESDNKHIDVGLLGSKTILNALSENGYPNLAWEVASQETYPSWGAWIVNGATTFYESWSLEAAKRVSMNHIMFGEISAWYYKALGGIKPDPSKPGFKNILLEPHFVDGLEHFEAKYKSPYGEIVSSWKRSNGKVLYSVTIPANSTATLYLKGNKILEGGNSLQNNKLIKILKNEKDNYILELKAGNYNFKIK
jgi:alpha-L-rhamnosidase